MRHRVRVPAPIGTAILLALVTYFAWWFFTFTGPSGELTPRSRARILFPIWGNTAIHNVGYTWARQGDTIVLDYDVKLDAGWFSLTVGKTRWPYRRLLRHEQWKAMRKSSGGQLRYLVRQDGLHTIRAGKYSVWSGEARVRWAVLRQDAGAR